MIELLAVGFLLYLGYLLFVKGYVWAILLIAFSIIGGAFTIWFLFPASHQVAIAAFGYNVSYAAAISMIITALGITFFECSGTS